MARNAYSPKEIATFISYCWDFYGSGGLYAHIFLPSLTVRELCNGVVDFLTTTSSWGGGYSTDREQLRDFIWLQRNKKASEQHGKVIPEQIKSAVKNDGGELIDSAKLHSMQARIKSVEMTPTASAEYSILTIRLVGKYHPVMQQLVYTELAEYIKRLIEQDQSAA